MAGQFISQLNLQVKPLANPVALAGGYALRMDVFGIRRANLKLLCEPLDAPARLKRDIALELDMSPSFLSQLLGGKKMGEDVARKIESARRLPHGWMDVLHSVEDPAVAGLHVAEPSHGYRASHDVRIDPETIAAAIKLVRLTFANLDLEFDSEEDGTPVAFAYEYLMQAKQQTVTPENLVDFSKKLAEKLRGVSNGDEGRGTARGTGSGDRGTHRQREAG